MKQWTGPCKLRLKAFALVLLLLTEMNGYSQVGGGLSVAGVASQIDGDTWGGYNKLGISFGGFAFYDFTDKLSLQVEILFGHRGSREVVTAFSQIALNMIDVPILARYKLIGDAASGLSVEAGLAPVIMLDAKSGIGALKRDQTANYKRLSVEAHAGLSWAFNENIGMFARWSYSVSNLNNTPSRRPWLTLHYISLGVRAGLKR